MTANVDTGSIGLSRVASSGHSGDSVRVWHVDLRGSQNDIEVETLDADTRDRADRFASDGLRTSYIRAHAAVRVILGKALDVPPERVPIRRRACPVCGGPHGKPYVAGPHGVMFSLSRTRDYAMIAESRMMEVGVDLEPVRQMADIEGLIRVGLTASERRALRRRLSCDPARGFLRQWVRKEAYLKGLGCGLSIPADQIAVPTANGDFGGPMPVGDGWYVTDIATGQGEVAALATARRPSIIATMRLTTSMR